MHFASHFKVSEIRMHLKIDVTIYILFGKEAREIMSLTLVMTQQTQG
jgi:hypothetical protein